MALITEDGTGLVDAESFCSVVTADAYHAARGHTAWADLDEDVKEQNLRKATDYMEQAYGERWAGYDTTDTQALSWPRSYIARRGSHGSYGYWDDDAVPVLVQRACAELALRAIDGDLAPDVGRLTKREKVDVIEVEYADNQPAWTVFRAIDDMLAPFFETIGSGLSRSLVRT